MQKTDGATSALEPFLSFRFEAAKA